MRGERPASGAGGRGLAPRKTSSVLVMEVPALRLPQRLSLLERRRARLRQPGKTLDPHDPEPGSEHDIGRVVNANIDAGGAVAGCEGCEHRREPAPAAERDHDACRGGSRLIGRKGRPARTADQRLDSLLLTRPTAPNQPAEQQRGDVATRDTRDVEEPGSDAITSSSARTLGARGRWNGARFALRTSPRPCPSTCRSNPTGRS